MSRIAKKPRSVKGVKGQKQAKKPPRYTIRKDTLGRRYAIEKRTGKRVSVSKADNERIRRRKTAEKIRPVFRRIKPPKPVKVTKPKTKKQKRSEAAKRGWETRRAKTIPIEVQQEQIVELGRQLGAFAIPEGMRMRVLNSVADRSEIYPKVQNAATEAFAKLQIEFYSRKLATLEKRPLPVPTMTPKFDKKHGVGMGQLVRDRLAGAMDLADIDQLIEEMAEDPDYDFSTRELYTLYFSPDVA